MSFMSNQWLDRGEGLRSRGYRPVSVTIVAGSASDSWSEEHKVVVQISATNEKSEYQTLHLTRLDSDKCAAAILNACSRKVRERLALQILKGMSVTTFLRSLNSVLRFRFRKPTGE